LSDLGGFPAQYEVKQKVVKRKVPARDGEIGGAGASTAEVHMNTSGKRGD
jgi:hypothetical protein